MAFYRYLFCDLVTNAVKAELPLTSVTYGQELNAAGSFSGHILLSDLRQNGYDIDAATTPSRTAVYVDRDGTIVWGGIIWSRTYDSDSQRLTVAGREFESYFEHRRITTNYIAPAGRDQFTVVQDLFNAAQAATGGNIGVVVPSITSGQTLASVLPIFAYEKRPVLDVCRELSRQASPYGFDFAIDCAYDTSGNIVKTLNLSYPRRGKVYVANSTNSPMIEMPGNMVSYSLPEDGNSVVNKMYGIGAGSNEGQYQSTYTDSGAIAAGYALLEGTTSLSQILNPTIVDSMTQAAQIAKATPVQVLNVVWDGYTDPTPGNFGTGDDFRIRITDARFSSTNNIVRRLAKFDVDAGESGPERISASFVTTEN